MAFASSLFCSSKFLEHTHTLTKRSHVLTTQRTYVPLPFSIFGSFYPNCFFLCQNIGWRYRRGHTILVFFIFCWAQFFAPPSEWRPRRLPIPPVGKTAPAYTHTHHPLLSC